METWRQKLERKEQETGKTSWWLKQGRAAENRQRLTREPWLADLAIDGDTLRNVDGEAVDLTGAEARVETTGELRRRVTATRLATTGVFALAAKKKVDDRTVFLTIEGPNVAEVHEYPAAKLDQVALRQFVATINSLARRQSPSRDEG